MMLLPKHKYDNFKSLTEKWERLMIEEMLKNELRHQSWLHFQNCNDKASKAELYDFQIVESYAHKQVIYELFGELHKEEIAKLDFNAYKSGIINLIDTSV